jgi:hypothetical protein
MAQCVKGMRVWNIVCLSVPVQVTFPPLTRAGSFGEGKHLFPLPPFESRIAQPVTLSLYQLSYPGSRTMCHIEMPISKTERN